MKLGKGVEWGLHLCMLMAFLDDGKTVEAAKLADYHDLPLPYLRKVLQPLAQAGVITSVSGPGGGYRLARPAADISFLDIVQALDGDAHAFTCTEIRQQGPTALGASCYPAACSIAKTVWAAEQAWRDQLGGVSLFDITGGLQALASPDQHVLAMTWLQENSRPVPLG